MYPIHIAFSSYAIIGLTLLILSATSAVYLLRLTSKSQATRSLLGFFIMVAFSGGATILANAFHYWDRLFVPWQDFWILAAGIALARFAYSLPHYERSLEAQVALVTICSLAFLSLIYCLIFDFRLIFYSTPGVDVNDAYYLLLPIGTLLIVVIFLRRSAQLSAQAEENFTDTKASSIWQHLLHPRSADAKVLRNLSLALSLAFLPGLQTLFSFPYPLGFILSNIGSILAIITIALVYLNYAPEINSFMAKLVGITLATMLLIFAIFGAVDVYNFQTDYSANRQRTISSIHDALIETGDLSANPLEVAYVVSWVADKPTEALNYRLIYRSDDENVFDLGLLIDENRKGFLKTPINDDWRFMRRYWTYPPGSSQEDYQSYIFVAEGMAYEIGFSSLVADDDLSAIVLKWLILIFASCAFVLLIFPLFYRRWLVKPLDNLLDGIKRVNQGELGTVIPLSFSDEIGFLTESFNRMAGTLNEARSELQNRAINLELEVKQRTIDLTQTNLQLQKENRDRETAQTRLNQQLIYQKALANCSQALLVTVNNESNQKNVLNQALEHLRSGAQVSRSYIFRLFEDPKLGPCIGMIAEVCAPGIPAQINNPANKKFPLSSLPADFVSVLAQGNHYGGLVKEVFTSTPALQEAFLAQDPPLLSMMLFPLLDRDRLRGFIGFDDCISERDWNEHEISMLHIASEMIGNTLQRWQVEEELHDTLGHLEERVRERTIEFAQANAELKHEIYERQRFQGELESKLEIESILANISTRLLETNKTSENIAASLEDLGHFIGLGRIFLAEFDLQTTNKVRYYIEWYSPELQPISEEDVESFMETLSGLRDQLRKGETIYIKDTTQFPSRRDIDMHSLQARGVKSLVLLPLTIDGRAHGVLGCSNLHVSPISARTNIRALELVASMLKSLLQREQLIQTLEEQVAERTRQLTTFLDMAMLSDQAQDLVDILQPALLSIIQIANFDAAAIHILKEKKSSLELVAQRGIPSEFLGPLSEIEMDTEFANWLKEASSYSILGEHDRGPVFPEPFCFPGYHAFFANRLSTADKSLGLLSCYRVADLPFSPFQATLLTALGELLGIIVENHRLRIETQELAAVEERQRLAREIHDAVSQSVYSLSLFARSAYDALEDGNEGKLLSNLQDIEGTALQAMREMRLLLYQLREANWDEDIATALDARFKQVEARLGIQATCDIDPDFTLPSQTQHEVWRIIIEALNNAVKHARPAHVRVQMTCQDEYLFVLVQDDGIGFNTQDHYPGMGLKNMQSRAGTLGGQLEFISEPGQGTEIKLKIPTACVDPEEGD